MNNQEIKNHQITTLQRVNDGVNCFGGKGSILMQTNINAYYITENVIKRSSGKVVVDKSEKLQILGLLKAYFEQQRDNATNALNIVRVWARK